MIVYMYIYKFEWRIQEIASVCFWYYYTLYHWLYLIEVVAQLRWKCRSITTANAIWDAHFYFYIIAHSIVLFHFIGVFVFEYRIPFAFTNNYCSAAILIHLFTQYMYPWSTFASDIDACTLSHIIIIILISIIL